MFERGEAFLIPISRMFWLTRVAGSKLAPATA
jgi:hypothetical protein